MSQLQLDDTVPTSISPTSSPLLTLQEENAHLRKQIKTLEGEKESLRAFLEQKIEILEAQVSSFKEREENMKRVNHTIMQTLEEMNEKGPKNGLKVKAIEELEKATMQYNQALLDLKTRMKEETGKLEMEVRELTETVIEKDYELKALKSFLKEMRMEYTSNRSVMESGVKNAGSVKEEKESVQGRVQTMPNYSIEKEGWTQGVLNGRRDTMRCYTSEKEDDMELLRTQSQVFDQNSLCYRDDDFGYNLKGASHRHKIEYYWKDLAKRKSRVENKDKLEELYLQNQGPMFQANSPTQHLLRRGTHKVLTSSTGESSTASLSEPRLQKGNIFSVSTISLTSDMNRPGMSDHWENSGQTLQERPVFTGKKEIGLKDPLWSAAFLDFKRKSIEQAFCQPRNTEGFRAIQELSMSGNYDINERGVFKSVPKTNNVKKPNKYKRQSQTCFENIEDVLRESKPTNREIDIRRESTEQYVKGEAYEEGDGEIMFQKQHNKDEEENMGAKSEIKFMIGRLLKVKNKLEKQSNVLNVSRTGQGWEQSVNSFQNTGMKEKAGENEKAYRLAMTERKQQNITGGKQESKIGFYGKKDNVQPRKLVR